jgi:hypothetical protein
MRRIHAMTLTMMLTGTLAGCAGVGKQDFACPGHPGKPLCLSASEVYRLTDGDALPQARPTPPPAEDAPRVEDELFLETPR